MPKRLEQARDTIRLRHYSIRTEESYLRWMKRFILFHNKRHPVEMGEPEVTAFLSHLAVDRHVSSSTQNQEERPGTGDGKRDRDRGPETGRETGDGGPETIHLFRSGYYVA